MSEYSEYQLKLKQALEVLYIARDMGNECGTVLLAEYETQRKDIMRLEKELEQASDKLLELHELNSELNTQLRDARQQIGKAYYHA